MVIKSGVNNVLVFLTSVGGQRMGETELENSEIQGASGSVLHPLLNICLRLVGEDIH